MLRGISCRNFRCFREKTAFPLAPLTVLVGPNNAGKSTAIDVLRLLFRGSTYQEVADGPLVSSDPLFKLDFRSGDHRLSSFDQVLSTDQETLDVGVQFDVSKPSDLGVRLTNEISIQRRYQEQDGVAKLQKIEGFLLPPRSGGELIQKGETARKRLFSIEYKYGETERPGHPPHEISDAIPGYLRAEYDLEDETVSLEEVKGKSATMPGADPSTEIAVTHEGVLEPPLIEVALTYVNALRDRKGEPRVDVTPRIAESLSSQFQVPKFLGSHFIDGLKLPEGWPPDYKDGLWKAIKDEILGPLAAEINEASRMSTTYVPSHRASGQAYYGPSDPLTDLLQSFENGKASSREEVNHWIEKLGLGQDLQVERKGPSLYEATIERNGERRSLAECGSGVSQLLPLILQFTVGDAETVGGAGEVLLVEEPEANLHPDLQARLADLFTDLAKGRTAVVETHSEYFIRRIQYLIARGEVDPNMVQLLYIEPPEDQSSSQVRPISIDEQGQLSEPFGPGFFDQATNLMVDLFKYGSEN